MLYILLVHVSDGGIRCTVRAIFPGAASLRLAFQTGDRLGAKPLP
jgi:hypothetical protein